MYNFELKFGKKKVKFQIEDKNYLNTLSLTKKVSQLTEEEIVRKSISNPIESDTLDKIINEDRLQAGPLLKPLNKDQTTQDGFHANEQGQLIWGNELKEFFG